MSNLLQRGWPLLATGGIVAPAVLRAPRAVRAYPQGVSEIEDAVHACRDSALTGWDLVENARMLTFRKFTRYSILHLWEGPRHAFRNSRGYCNQYNGALAKILEQLGIEVERVFATRVRVDDNPWWRMGHTWLRVTIDGRTLDVCAGCEDNRPGRVTFIPVTEVLPFSRVTYLNTNNGMILFTLFHVWKSILLGRQLPRWMYRPFGEPVKPS